VTVRDRQRTVIVHSTSPPTMLRRLSSGIFSRPAGILDIA
jgi:hypothetical protein